MTRFSAPARRALLLVGMAFLMTSRGSAQDPGGNPGTAIARPLVEINTVYGRMVVELYNETPLHRDHFLKLVREHYYDSLLFHRVIPGFMVQGGDPNSRTAAPGVALGNGDPPYTLPAEIHPELVHVRGALAAARLGDEANPEKRSSGSQFYLVDGKNWTAAELQHLLDRKNARDPHASYAYTPEQVQAYVQLGGAPHLDGDYTVFGRVIEGVDVLDALSAVPCDGQDRPLTDVRMWMRVKK